MIQSLSSSAARGGAITLGFQAARLCIMFASIVILARLISPAEYGYMAMVMALIGIAEIFRDFGLSMAALQAKDLSPAQKSNLFWINLGVGVLLSAIVFALARPIADFYGVPLLEQIVQVSSVTYALSGASTQFRVQINRELRFFALSLTDLLPYFLGFVAALVVAIGGAGVWALVLQQVVVAAMTLFLGIVFARWWPSLPRRAPMGNLLKFGGSLAATRLLSYLTRNVDSIAIGRVWGATSVGLYDRAFQLVVLPLNQINTPLSRVAVPVLSRIEDDKDRYLRYLRRAQLVALYVTSAGFLILAALGPQIVRVVLGPDWDAAGNLVSLLALGGIFRSLAQVCYWIYMSRGLAGVQLRFYAVAQPLLAAVIVAGVIWGPEGVAIAHSAGYAAFWVVSLLWVGRAAKLDVRPMLADAVRAVLIFGAPAAVLAFVVRLLTEDRFSDLVTIGLGLTSAVVWYALCWVLLGRIRSDLGTLAEFARLALGRKR